MIHRLLSVVLVFSCAVAAHAHNQKLVVVPAAGRVLMYTGGKLTPVEMRDGALIKSSDGMLAFQASARTFKHLPPEPAPKGVPLAPDSPALLAYVTNTGEFWVSQAGNTTRLSYSQPQSFKVSTDLIAYVTNTGEFWVWVAGNSTRLSYSAPKSFKVGQGSIAYVTNTGEFWMWTNGNATRLSYSEPKDYVIGSPALQ